jgi:hypothetical protein
MICGQDYGAKFFVYRSSSKLSDFFSNCNLPYAHDGSTRAYWVRGVLDQLNENVATNPQLPSDGLVRVIQELLELTEPGEGDPDRAKALSAINKTLSRESLEVYRDGSGRIHLRNPQTQATSAGITLNKRVLTETEIKNRKRLEDYLLHASEDDVIEKVLVPIFRQIGFLRITVAGHKDKALEYGKDVWMKFQLPTSHYLYFGMQVKKVKIDSAGKSEANIGEILNQISMMMGHPIWDPELNRKCLLDHVFIISADAITKQAKNFLAEKLDIEARRRIIFMERADIIDLATSINFAFGGEDKHEGPEEPKLDDVPF